MAPEPLFIDSGGFYALVSAQSAAHANAVGIMEESRRVRRRAVTTDLLLAEPIFGLIINVSPRSEWVGVR